VWFVAGCNRGSSQTPGRSGGGPVSVEALVVKPQPLENKIFTTGTMLANEEVELRPEISGRVTGVFFAEGQRIRQGEVLLKLNDRELQAQLKRKQLEETLAGDEERRQRALFEINGISREEYDKTLNKLNMIKAEREVIESQLAETEIIAPFDGVVGLRYVSEGSYVSSNTMVAAMQDIDPVKAEFSVPEKYAGQLSRGAKIVVQVGDEQNSYAGTIYAVEAKIDPGTRTLKARATVPNPDARLLPGSFAKVEITLEELPDAIVIPSGAVIPRINDEIVYVCRNGKAQSLSVKTGIRNERGIQITEGLTPGDTLIVTGLLQLADGKDVRINAFQND
jgi:membrane fusion protein (multidrug efflux system)